MLTCLAADLGPVRYIVMLGNVGVGRGAVDFQASQCIPMGPNLPLSLGVVIALQHGLRIQLLKPLNSYLQIYH